MVQWFPGSVGPVALEVEKRMKRTFGWLAPVVAALLSIGGASWVSPARATVMVEIPLEDLARGAVAIVHGRVERSSGHLDLETGKPHTLTTIRVHEWMKGSGGETLVLREVGGTYAQGELHYAIDGVPDYRLGEEVVVFLDEDQGGDFYRTHEMVQGKFVVELAVPGMPRTVRRDTEAVAFARWTEGRMVFAQGAPTTMAFATFRDVVTNAVALTPTLPGSTGGVTQ
ncbi:MAG: hypothetical protein CMN30_00505 [Sandaracinus sp.]|nr:hypothetical protein [Sandaracinus sp.]|tara:strand:+ start:1031 stop:1711 length:681 start_codon:yes stop_codon:yes gene_type:complete